MKKLLLFISIVVIILFYSSFCFAQFNDKLSWSAIPIKHNGSTYDGGIKRSPTAIFAKAYINEKACLLKMVALSRIENIFCL